MSRLANWIMRTCRPLLWAEKPVYWDDRSHRTMREAGVQSPVTFRCAWMPWEDTVCVRVTDRCGRPLHFDLIVDGLCQRDGDAAAVRTVRLAPNESAVLPFPVGFRGVVVHAAYLIVRGANLRIGPMVDTVCAGAGTVRRGDYTERSLVAR